MTNRTQQQCKRHVLLKEAKERADLITDILARLIHDDRLPYEHELITIVRDIRRLNEIATDANLGWFTRWRLRKTIRELQEYADAIRA